jgi:hypothetical protein
MNDAAAAAAAAVVVVVVFVVVFVVLLLLLLSRCICNIKNICSVKMVIYSGTTPKQINFPSLLLQITCFILCAGKS